jgi:general stress protein YciG
MQQTKSDHAATVPVDEEEGSTGLRFSAVCFGCTSSRPSVPPNPSAARQFPLDHQRRREKMATEHRTSHEHEKSGKGQSASGTKGVSQEQVGSGKDKDPNNFANNPARAAAAGRKGGHDSHKQD